MYKLETYRCKVNSIKNGIIYVTGFNCHDENDEINFEIDKSNFDLSVTGFDIGVGGTFSWNIHTYGNVIDKGKTDV
jgi:hypothetical protein